MNEPAFAIYQSLCYQLLRDQMKILVTGASVSLALSARKQHRPMLTHHTHALSHTGGAGFLGSHMCDLLLKQGHEVYCVDNLFTGSLDNLEEAQRLGAAAEGGANRFHFAKHDVIEPLDAETVVRVAFCLSVSLTLSDSVCVCACVDLHVFLCKRRCDRLCELWGDRRNARVIHVPPRTWLA